MNNKTKRRTKIMRKDARNRMKSSGESFEKAYRYVISACSRIADGGTNHNGGQGNTRFAYGNI